MTIPHDAIRLLPRPHRGDRHEPTQVSERRCRSFLAIAISPTAWAFEGAELYAGEKTLYEAARKEGLVVSFDTGPTWANWANQFKAFQKRYPGVEMVYNDLGSAATVVALDKARNRPQADTAYYFAASALWTLRRPASSMASSR